MICTGYNHAGTPILNGHSQDSYHVPLTSITSGATTIKLNTTTRPVPNGVITFNNTLGTQTKSITVPEDSWVFLKLTVTEPNNWVYTFTSNVSSSGDFIPEAYLYKQQEQVSGMTMYLVQADFACQNISSSNKNFRITLTGSGSSQGPTPGVYYLQVRPKWGSCKAGTMTVSCTVATK